MNGVHSLPAWNIDPKTAFWNFPNRTSFWGHSQNLRNRGRGKISGSALCRAHKMTGNLKLFNWMFSNIHKNAISAQKYSWKSLQRWRRPFFKSTRWHLSVCTVKNGTSLGKIDIGGLADKSFHSMVERMLLSLNNFASHCSSWTMDQIENIEVWLAKAKHINAFSYLALPRQLSGTWALLNIRNREDENCFLYSYTAAYHLKYGPRDVPVGFWSRRITSPATYWPANPNKKHANDQFNVPMGFHQMVSFVELDDVCVNIFRWQF